MSVVSLTTLLTICFLSTPDSRQVDLSAGARGPVNGVATSSSPAPRHWMTSYEEARVIAVRNKLPLLLHFDAPWCGACRRMETEVLNRSEVTAMLGTAVVGVRVNADHNKDLIAEFGISTLPTEVVVFADGTRGSRYTGAQDLTAYVARLNSISGQNQQTIAESGEVADNNQTRSCLIVRHDGKMVGMGGFSPVALTTQKQWIQGSDQFVATHEGVDYFLQSAQEVAQFNEDPERYIPKMHGCDLVELSLENRATSGSIEFGSFYQGKLFFFANLQNRERFENNPAWYLGVMADRRTANNKMFPFLNSGISNN